MVRKIDTSPSVRPRKGGNSVNKKAVQKFLRQYKKKTDVSPSSSITRKRK